MSVSVSFTTFLPKRLLVRKILANYVDLTLDVHTKTLVGLYIKCLFSYLDSNLNWNFWTNVSKPRPSPLPPSAIVK